MNARIRQLMIAIAQKIQLFLKPQTIQGKDAILQLPDLLKKHHIKQLFIMTTKGTMKRGSINHLLSKLDQEKINYSIFDDIPADPDTHCLQLACTQYRKYPNAVIIAIGGGSVMDCAKLVAALATQTHIDEQDIIQNFHIRHKLPLLIAIPTTAGSGSEVSAGAVITNPIDQRKYPLADLRLIPKYAILDPSLSLSLPANMTAYSGMDALTHAIEAYLNHFNTRATKRYAIHAVKLVFENLPIAYKNGNYLPARQNMLTAAYEAGIAMTNNYVGYVHALAHGIGGKYHLPHGYLNAILLPYVLEEYGTAITKKLARLAKEIGIQATDDTTLATQFIEHIRQLNTTFQIPSSIAQIEETEIETLANAADKESNPTYPTPVQWNTTHFKHILYRASQHNQKEELS